jgi:hypothetical protein
MHASQTQGAPPHNLGAISHLRFHWVQERSSALHSSTTRAGGRQREAESVRWVTKGSQEQACQVTSSAIEPWSAYYHWMENMSLQDDRHTTQATVQGQSVCSTASWSLSRQVICQGQAGTHTHEHTVQTPVFNMRNATPHALNMHYVGSNRKECQVRHSTILTVHYQASGMPAVPLNTT